jgi:hypothetical protein
MEEVEPVSANSFARIRGDSKRGCGPVRTVTVSAAYRFRDTSYALPGRVSAYLHWTIPPREFGTDCGIIFKIDTQRPIVDHRVYITVVKRWLII